MNKLILEKAKRKDERDRIRAERRQCRWAAIAKEVLKGGYSGYRMRYEPRMKKKTRLAQSNSLRGASVAEGTKLTVRKTHGNSQSDPPLNILAALACSRYEHLLNNWQHCMFRFRSQASTQIFDGSTSIGDISCVCVSVSIAAFRWKGKNGKDSAKTFGIDIGDDASDDLFRTEVCKVFESAKQWAIENLEEHHY